MPWRPGSSLAKHKNTLTTYTNTFSRKEDSILHLHQSSLTMDQARRSDSSRLASSARGPKFAKKSHKDNCTVL